MQNEKQIQFIKRAQEVHGSIYDYSQVIYKNSNTKVCIRCYKHGEFYQLPKNHIFHQQGCPQCSGNKKKTTEKFIKEAQTIHGSKYDYSQSVYINTNTPVCVICPKHGEFYPTPGNHIRKKSGCPRCNKSKKTLEDFIRKAQVIHGHKYDYSQSTYVNSSTHICVICPQHGKFYLTPFGHVNNQTGCPICSRIKFTTQDFIEKANRIHNNRYDYSKSIYVNSRSKIVITCREHGDFQTTPNIHINSKSGCPLCWRIKLTTEKFIERAKIIHKDKYDYSKSIYTKAKTKLCIICPEHGEFYTTPNSHIYHQAGCAICSGVKKLTTKEFIEKANKIHHNRYNYSKAVYKSAKQKICIICPEHGKFWQKAEHHLAGHICIMCSGIHKKTTKEFIEKANEIHQRKYDYSNVTYKNAKEKVCIICPEHGEFWQRAEHHLKGHGCCKCKTSNLEKSVKETLIQYNIEFEQQKKFNWLGRQRLDFYLPHYRIAIECQGIQHFQPVDFGNKGEKWAQLNLERLQENDLNKHELCRRNDIHLVYFTLDTPCKLKIYTENIFFNLNELIDHIAK